MFSFEISKKSKIPDFKAWGFWRNAASWKMDTMIEPKNLIGQKKTIKTDKNYLNDCKKIPFATPQELRKIDPALCLSASKNGITLVDKN